MAAIIVDANSAVVTAGGEDAPSPGTVETLTVTTINDFPVLSGGEWFHAIDAVDKGKTSAYEVIKVTADANGTGVTWTVTRGDIGTPHAHAAGWTLIPVLSAEMLNSAFSGGSGGGMPIANPTGITTGTETPDPISGSDSAEWVKFPSDATVMAWGLAGDSFPRWVFSADPNTFGLVIGDGTFDPAVGHPATYSTDISTERGVIPFIRGATFSGPVLGAGAFTVVSTNPQGTLGGKVGDGCLTPSGLFVCTTAGDASTAIWSLRFGPPAPVAIVSAFATEVTSSPPSGAATIDGYAVVTGDRVLLTAQTTGHDNGIWLANTAGAWTRPPDWATGAVIPDGTLVSVGYTAGQFLFSSIWSSKGAITVGTTATSFLMLASGPGANLSPQAGTWPELRAEGIFHAAGLVEMETGPFVAYSGTATSPVTLTGSQTVSLASAAITLPDPTTHDGAHYTIKDTGAGTASVHPHASETIDGASSISLSAYEAVTVMSNGVNWFVIGQVATTVL